MGFACEKEAPGEGSNTAKIDPFELIKCLWIAVTQGHWCS